MVNELVEAIRGRRASLNTAAAREGLEICLASYRSVALGMPVQLPLDEDVDVVPILAAL